MRGASKVGNKASVLSTWGFLYTNLTSVHLQIPYTHKLVDPQNKPEDFKALYASIVANTDDSAKVPVIVGACPLPPYISTCVREVQVPRCSTLACNVRPSPLGMLCFMLAPPRHLTLHCF